MSARLYDCRWIAAGILLAGAILTAGCTREVLVDVSPPSDRAVAQLPYTVRVEVGTFDVHQVKPGGELHLARRNFMTSSQPFALVDADAFGASVRKYLDTRHTFRDTLAVGEADLVLDLTPRVFLDPGNPRRALAELHGILRTPEGQEVGTYVGIGEQQQAPILLPGKTEEAVISRAMTAAVYDLAESLEADALALEERLSFREPIQAG